MQTRPSNTINDGVHPNMMSPDLMVLAPPTCCLLLTDLTAATVYHLRLAARTSRGLGPSTDMIQLQTLDYGTTTVLNIHCRKWLR